MEPIVFQLCFSVVTMTGYHGFHFAAGQESPARKLHLKYQYFIFLKCIKEWDISLILESVQRVSVGTPDIMLDGSTLLFPYILH